MVARFCEFVGVCSIYSEFWRPNRIPVVFSKFQFSFKQRNVNIISLQNGTQTDDLPYGFVDVIPNETGDQKIWNILPIGTSKVLLGYDYADEW